MTDPRFDNFLSKLAQALLGRAPPRPAEPERFVAESRLDECMDGVDQDDNAASFVDVTQATLEDMRQEESHSLDRDPQDPFFWRQARPDAVAGMAKVHLKSRCPTPYWRGLVSANAYGLWGLVAMARARAEALGEPCHPQHAWSCARAPLCEQASLLREACARATPGQLSDLGRADGLARPGVFLGEINLHATLRLLFAAISQGQAIDWPDLPARLGEEDEIPDALPALMVDPSDLSAKLCDITKAQADEIWNAQIQGASSQLLMIPDWASWMLASQSREKPFAKWPAHP